MSQITVGESEGIESALRRFKRQVSKSGILTDFKRLSHNETPFEKYKRKAKQKSLAYISKYFPKKSKSSRQQ